jgi:hypothetical protein
MRCEELQDYSTDYLAGTLAEADRANVLGHLVSCSACRTEMEGLQSVWRMRDLADVAAPSSAAMRQRFLESLEASPVISKREPRFALQALAAIALLGMAVFAAQQTGLVPLIAPRQEVPPPATIQPAPQPVAADPAPQTAVIEGIVRAQDSSEPISGALIVLSPADIPIPSGRTRGAPGASGVPAVLQMPGVLFTTTDRDGRFVLKEIPEGQYRIRAERDGYTVKSVELLQGKPIERVDFSLARDATIAGQLADPSGRALVGASVRAYRLTYEEGRRELKHVVGVTTNDRGEFRIFPLIPGEYYLQASSRDNSFATAYYPGVVDVSKALAVTVGEGLIAQDLRIDVPLTPTFKLAGRVITDKPNAGADFYIIPRNPKSISPAGGIALNNPLDAAQYRYTHGPNTENLFELPGLPPGSYYLYAMIPSGRANPSYAAGRMAIDVGNQDITDLRIGMRPNGTITGRIRPDDASSLPVSSLKLLLTPLENIPAMLRMTAGYASINTPRPPDSTGVFTLSNIPEGRYRLSIPSLPQDVYIDEILQGGSSVFDRGLEVSEITSLPIEIVLGHHGGTLAGVVESRATVVLVPDAEQRQNSSLYKRVTSDSSGRFRLTGIHPGNYKIFAFENIPEGAEQDAEYLAKYEGLGLDISIPKATVTTLNRSLSPISARLNQSSR